MPARKTPRSAAAAAADNEPGELPQRGALMVKLRELRVTRPDEVMTVMEQGIADGELDEDYRCHRCGKTYPRDFYDNWGSDGIGGGYGPLPVCTNLVNDRLGRALEVCRGPLVPNV